MNLFSHIGGYTHKELFLVRSLKFLHSWLNEIMFFMKSWSFWRLTNQNLNCLLGGLGMFFEKCPGKATSVVWAPQNVGWKYVFHSPSLPTSSKYLLRRCERTPYQRSKEVRGGPFTPILTRCLEAYGLKQQKHFHFTLFGWTKYNP